MTDQNELDTVERECSYGPFYGFCTLFMNFYGKNNNYGGHLWHDFLLNTFMVPRFMARLMGIIITTAFMDAALYRTGFCNYHATTIKTRIRKCHNNTFFC